MQMSETIFDPEAPLPGAPEPWAGSAMPRLRAGPPYAMTEMIAAEPALAERLLRRLNKPDSPAAALAAAVGKAATAGDLIRVIGCGTSENAAMGVALILAGALREKGLGAARIEAGQSFEVAAEPAPELGRGLLIAISHEGGTWATNLALAAARAAGARTALVTVGARSPGAAIADLVVPTLEQDQSWCHTVGYLSPLLAAVAAGGFIRGAAPDPAACRALVAASAANPSAVEGAERASEALAEATHLIVVASGVDRPAAHELALKVEEAAHLPAVARDLETLLHGHLAATDPATGLVLILAGRDGRGERVTRARQALDAAAAIGVRCAAILAAGVEAAIPPERTPAGRLIVPEAPDLPAAVAALLASAPALQLLTERLARARGRNPDTLRRTESAYGEAARRYE